jgi:superfamily II DNA or RNA helicase/HJR/Mrr/RecB family endonuclease
MALFRPSEKLIQGYRDKLQIVTLKDPLPIPSKRVEHYCIKPGRLEFLTPTGQVASPSVKVSVVASKTDCSMACFKDQVDPTIGPNEPCDADLHFPRLELRQGNLLSVEDVRELTNTAACKPPASSAREVQLISNAQLSIHSVNPANFNVVLKGFSFLAAKEHPAGTLFGQHKARQTETLRVGPITPPTPPPSLNKESLQERLRRLLTPPIHEILSDPQLALPERPFPYQTYGIKWLYDRESALLADEMGLGKTMQAIIAARLLWRDRTIEQILIVCPKSLIANWRKELGTWWPGVECYTRVAGQDRQAFLRDATNDTTVKIINYEMLARELDWLKEKRPTHDLVIIDEAQRIKNANSKAAQAVKALDAKRRWALTGTPLENSIKDLISVFGFVRSGLIRESHTMTEIRESIKPYMLRRRQEEVVRDLPKMIGQDIEIELGDQQREAYDRAEQEGIVELNEKGESITITHVFALINKLRQICNFHPITSESAKADFVLEELEDIIESGRKALVFGSFVEEPFGLKRLAKVISESKSFVNRERPLELHGGIPQQRHATIIERFQNDPGHQLLLANYKVGGVGLNLQAANYVFLFDRWWNPALEDQAIKRIHRLGQKLPVFAIRLFCNNTIEERILNKLEEKRRIFINVIEGIDERPPEASVGLSEDEIFSLFNLKVRPRRTSRPVSPAPIVLDNLDPGQFENLVGMIYEKDGYKVEITGRSHDGGVDIVAERISAGGTDRIVVQCKHQKQNVGRPALQQLWGVVHSDPSVTRCDFVTSAGYTTEAQDFVRGKRLTLIDRGKLMELAQKFGVAEFVDLAPAQKSAAENQPQPIPESGSTEQQVAASQKAKTRRPRLAKWDGSMRLGEVRARLKQRKEFKGSWEDFLGYLGLPLGVGLTKDTTVAEALRIGGE